MTNKAATMRSVAAAVYAEELRATTAEGGLDAKLTTVESIAKGANQAKSYGTYQEMIGKLEDPKEPKLNIGQSLLIGTRDVPDLWIYDISTTSYVFNYESEEAFAEKLKKDKFVRVGYYVLYPLETQKVNLEDYAKSKDLSDEVSRAKQAEAANTAAIGAMETSIGLIRGIAEDAKSTAERLSGTVIENIQPKLDTISSNIDKERERATKAEEMNASAITTEKLYLGN